MKALGNIIQPTSLANTSQSVSCSKSEYRYSEVK